MATLGPTIDVNGISIPTYADIFLSLQNQYRSIFGSDVVLDADSQDGQWIGIIASAINDDNMASVATYNQFSPATAQGAGLSSVVKINGIARQIATNSTADVLIVGTAGTTITNGRVGDTLDQSWSLPSSVTIPPAGQITVTATAGDVGDIEALANTITKILTPTRGWQTVNNVAAATPGSPVETDAQLRQRQALSTALSSYTPLKGLVGAVASLSGVTQVMPYENDTNATDANGIPPHAIGLVVEGGDAQAIAQTIFDKKTLGTGTYGSTVQTVVDSYGVGRQIRFSRATAVAVQVQITLSALPGYTSAIGTQIQNAVAAYIDALPIGADVYLSKVYVPASLSNGAGSQTFDIQPSGIIMGKNGGSKYLADIVIAWNEDAGCIASDVIIVVV